MQAAEIPPGIVVALVLAALGPGLLLGLLLGYWYGYRIGHRRGVRADAPQASVDRQASDASAETGRSPASSAAANGGGPSTSAEEGIGRIRERSNYVLMDHVAQQDSIDSASAEGVNDLLRHVWPFCAEYVQSYLFSLEPDIQSLMPYVLKGVGFSRTKCHLGKVPVQLRGMRSGLERSHHPHGGSDDSSVTIVCDVDWESDCEVELELLQSLLGTDATHGPTLGVTRLSVVGRCVIEFAFVSAEPPFCGGVRIYFANPPTLDLELSAQISSLRLLPVGALLNMAAVKETLLKAVSQRLGATMVLPNRLALPLVRDIDTFLLKAPKPDGILRIAVLELCNGDDNDEADAGVAGHCRHERCYVELVCGNHIWSSASQPASKRICWEVESSADFIVHDQQSQHVQVSLHREDRSKVWPHLRGELLGRCTIPVRVLLEHAGTLGSGSWWPLMASEASNESRSAPSSADASAAAAREEPEDAVRRLVTRTVPGAGVPQVKLAMDWRLLLHGQGGRAPATPAPTVVGSGARGSHWSLRAFGDDVEALLLIGIYSVHDLAIDGREYRCEVSCTPVAHDDGARDADGANICGNGSDDRSRRSIRSLVCVPSSVTSTPSLGGAPPGAGTALDEDVGESRRITLDVNEPATFKLSSPEEQAKVTISLYEACNLGGSEKCVASLQYGVKRLYAQPSLEEALEPALTLAPTRAGYVNAGVLRPRVRMVAKLWPLGPAAAYHGQTSSDADVAVHL
eukprot:TRINITY_DN32225_c0_g1_i1.p1 TRINITY_DN32225_c0_g1~~TRINITY_DN32225_c0_g1_i1.p1  ORF type:complete len:743 (+),score=137.98 TRINITY_DN32225_c0_g1_i1:146-2374(+)